jgi:hypothetical protein
MKQAIFVPLAALSVGAAFAIVGGLVWLSHGRIAALVRAKLLLGGLLLTLGVGGSACGGGTIACYAPPASNYVSIDGRAVDLRVSPFVRGTISHPAGASFSFVLSSMLPQIAEVARGPLVADDGAFDQSLEAFSVRVPSSLPAGDYKLEIFVESSGVRTWLSASMVHISNG